MFEIEDRSWISRSVIAAQAEAEIRFCLAPTFHPDPYDIGEDAHEIDLPPAAKHTQHAYDVPSKTVFGQKEALLAHYRAVLNLAAEHRHDYNAFHHHFWLCLDIGGPHEWLGFRYHTYDDMTRLFDWLSSAVDGDLWSDCGQGWDIIAVCSQRYFHFRQGGFDQGGEYLNVALPKAALLTSIAALRARMQSILDTLSSAIGEDYWSSHRYDLRSDL